ncbi:VOC family protein [Angustibacter sp. Root456]|uniref:VOC family protein n=1 Tax=Angustibacter sp. Root456 TaxID=1736539 RepID=UPI0006F6954C|nr:VOC family protein [Angustibacter sp. Root456]KQX61674.1 3-demethylubiquinone-9 3-methyltransferase [Angustibacter sp. Root456]
MATKLNPYLNFQGTTREAMEFYRDVFGGELTLSTFGDFQASQDPAEQDKIMHAQLVSPGGLTLMAADSPNAMPYTPGNNYSVSLSGDDESELHGYWGRLSDGGTVVMPLDKAPWGDAFGMCVDRFGVSWLVNIAGSAA